MPTDELYESYLDYCQRNNKNISKIKKIGWAMKFSKVFKDINRFKKTKSRGFILNHEIKEKIIKDLELFDLWQDSNFIEKYKF